ncbi:hypothetical protein NEAUS04_0062 [Nematocida ausubeli]|uniref:CNH domain-containing protein n=1 Tax=Nematocida ausubeli (strain ATCC PRA-371 / ERTm2) TaxID=1913371 RepID=A0A086J099_NEMA1|nr:uncharacterized protein NESG_02346 [Nematocida ausubeli]KAI5160665.1 hypothetical protein NEAUS04_0062 [Nematocida ausubeli]KFG25567.1 hypothetical protein NESG_02346 [Nematocida ausubeli]
MYFYRKSPLTHVSIKVSEIKHSEKLTCISTDRKLYGGFLGNIYLLKGTSPRAVFKIEPPVSFIAHIPLDLVDRVHALVDSSAGSSFQENPASFQNFSIKDYIIGDWDGNVYIAGVKIKVSPGAYPIKHILPTPHGLLVCDTTQMYMVQEGGISSMHIGTWPFDIKCTDEDITVTAGYAIHYARVDGDRLSACGKAEFLRNESHTESITCIAEEETSLVGTIGGWIMELENSSEQKHCTIKKVLKVAGEKLTGLLLYACMGASFYICSTPTSIYVIDAKCRNIIESLEITKDNGIFAIEFMGEHKDMLAIFDRNFKIYTIDLQFLFPQTENRESQAQDTPSTQADTYDDLLRELNAGKFD